MFFSQFYTYSCVLMIADVTRDVVPQLFSEKMFFFTIIVASVKVIEHYAYFFSLLFCLNYPVFNKDGTQLIARK